MNNNEQLGEYMIDSGNEFGPGTAYGRYISVFFFYYSTDS